MKILTTKKIDSKKRKLTQINDEGNGVFIVEIDDVEGNIKSAGTPITDEVLALLNMKDEKELQFTQLADNNLPAANEYVQIVLKVNGELWCIPSLDSSISSYKIADDSNREFLTINGTQYTKDFNLEYFNLTKGIKMFGTQTRLGAIPARTTEGNAFNDGTYIELNNTGTITLYNNGKKCYEFNKTNFLMKPNVSKFEIDEEDKVSINSVNKLNLQAGTFMLKSAETEVLESSDLTKFNCHTNLDKASYGNGKFRLQFYENSIRLRNIDKEVDIINIDEKGNVTLCNDFISSIVNKYNNKMLLTNYVDQKIYYELNQDADLYEIVFSDTEDSEVMSITIMGSNIDSMSNIYMPQTGSYYRVCQYIAVDDSEDSYIEVRKETSSGLFRANAYIRAIFKL